jgi:hypothetical protein
VRTFLALALVLFTLKVRADAAGTAAATISGTVVSTTGDVVAGAHVAAVSPSGRYEAQTDAHGAFRLLGVLPDTYTISVDARGFITAVRRGVTVQPSAASALAVRLTRALTTIGAVQSTVAPLVVGATAEQFTVANEGFRLGPDTSGLGAYSSGSVQGMISAVPGINLDTFGNAIVRGGKVGDTVFEYDSVPIPQGLIAEPGGNIAGAQLATTGVGTTVTTIAGFTNQSDNVLGAVVDQIPLTGTFPSRTSIQVTDGLGPLAQRFALQNQWATADLRWRYAFATTLSSEYFTYGDGQTFYPSEAATYGLSLQTRGAASLTGNVHFHPTQADDFSFVALWGRASYQQYASPYPGESVGAFDGANTTFPGETNPQAPVNYASGVQGTYDVLKLQWLHTSTHATTRLQLYRSQFGSTAGGPFWDDLSFPDGVISLASTQGGRETGGSVDVTQYASDRHHVIYGLEYRTNTSFLYQVVPAADQQIRSNPTIFSGLAYFGDTWSIGPRVSLSGTARFVQTHIVPSDGGPYDVTAIDPHAAIAYRVGGVYALRITYDHSTVPPKPLEADRTDSANPAPFVPLAAETANNFTFGFEGGGRTRFRIAYYSDREANRIDVLPANFRSALAAGQNPNGVGVPTNVGSLVAHGIDAWVGSGGLTFKVDWIRGFSSSASQFAFNGLNAAAVAAGHLFPLGYVPDLTATLSYEFSLLQHRLRITPSISYQSGFPYGNGTRVYTFDSATGQPVPVPNDNFVNPGFNYYFLANPALPFNANTNPYIGNLGTPEGPDPNSLRAPPQTLVALHVEADLTRRLTVLLDVANLFATSTPTGLQGNPYLIGPPGYAGGNPLYAAAYQNAAGFAQPYVLGNGVPTNDGVSQAVPWQYGRAGYVPQGYPLARSFQISLRYRF